MEHFVVNLDVNNSNVEDLVNLWNSSGNYFQGKWDQLLTTTGDSPIFLYVYGTFLITTIEYWLLVAVYYFLDTADCMAIVRKRYKILEKDQAITHYQDTRRLLRVAKNVLFNQAIISIPVGYLTYYLGTIRGHMPIGDLPSPLRILFDIAVLILCEEIGFYYVHRMLHHRLFYRYHKIHHEWSTPIAMAAIYCHPVEHLFCNLLPIFGGLILLGSHVVTCWIWIGAVYFTVLYDHSGYHFPFFFSSEAHSYHHRRSTTFFGVFGWLDWLHGTDTVWRRSKGYSRHKVLLDFGALSRQ